MNGCILIMERCLSLVYQWQLFYINISRVKKVERTSGNLIRRF